MKTVWNKMTSKNRLELMMRDEWLNAFYHLPEGGVSGERRCDAWTTTRWNALPKCYQAKIEGVADATPSLKANEIILQRGDKVTYTRHFMFSMSCEETATVVMVKGQTAILDNGDKVSKHFFSKRAKFDLSLNINKGAK